MDKLRMAVNAALNQQSMFNSNFRAGLVAQMGSDDKRKYAWQEYGWKTNLDFMDFYNLYDRQGVAYGVVNLLNDKCFETNPWVIEGDEFDEKRPETPWEKEFRLLAKRSKLWHAFKTADQYRLVGRFAGLILRIADGKEFDQPVDSSKPVIREIICAWEGQLTPDDIVTDTRSEFYGQPAYWTYNEGEVIKDDDVPPRNLKIHPDRIIILGDWRGGRSFLKAAYNAFVNLEKVEGGSGESYLKNAGRQMHVNYDKEVNLAQIARDYKLDDVGQLQELFNKEARDLNNGGDRLMITQGATATPLVSAVADPSPHYDISIQTVAASTGLPAKVIVGMQTGERASVEDLKQFNKRGQGRREGPLAMDGDQIVEHLVRIKVISAAPKGETTFMWDDLTEATLSEKLAFADQMATINQKNAGTGEPAVYLTAEMREVSGFENGPVIDAARADILPDAAEPIIEEGP